MKKESCGLNKRQAPEWANGRRVCAVHSRQRRASAASPGKSALKSPSAAQSYHEPNPPASGEVDQASSGFEAPLPPPKEPASPAARIRLPSAVPLAPLPSTDPPTLALVCPPSLSSSSSSSPLLLPTSELANPAKSSGGGAWKLGWDVQGTESNVVGT